MVYNGLLSLNQIIRNVTSPFYHWPGLVFEPKWGTFLTLRVTTFVWLAIYYRLGYLTTESIKVNSYKTAIGQYDSPQRVMFKGENNNLGGDKHPKITELLPYEVAEKFASKLWILSKYFYLLFSLYKCLIFLCLLESSS